MGFLKGLMDKLDMYGNDESYDDFEAKEVARKKSAAPDNVAPIHNDNGPIKRHTASNYGTSTFVEKNRNNEKSLRMVRPQGSKIVPLQTMNDGLELCVIKAHSFDETQDICDAILSGCCAIVNLQEVDVDLAQRILDFVMGAVYSINGKIMPITEEIYIIAPENVDVSGDVQDILVRTGYDLSAINR